MRPDPKALRALVLQRLQQSLGPSQQNTAQKDIMIPSNPMETDDPELWEPDEPVRFGSIPAAATLAKIWGVSVEQAYRLMEASSGKQLTPERQQQILDAETADAERQRLQREWNVRDVAEDPTAWTDPSRNTLASPRKGGR